MQKKTLIVSLAFVLGIVALVAVVNAAHWSRERRLQALFEGPCQVVSDSTAPRYYSRWRYDLTAYLDEAEPVAPLAESAMPRPADSGPGGEDWVEGATRAELEAMRQSRRSVDAQTGATSPVDHVRWRSVYRERIPSEALRISYPPDGAVFPPNLCAPYVEWDDPVNDLWQVVVDVPGTDFRSSSVTDRRRWQFPPGAWRAIQDHAGKGPVSIQIRGIRHADLDAAVPHVIQASEPVHFGVSEDPIDSYIVYRLVTPRFSVQKTPSMFVRDLRSFEVVPFLRARRHYCFNCHTFSSKSGTEGMLSIKARLVVGPPQPSALGIVDLATGSTKKVSFPFSHKGFTFTSWNPAGTRLAVSANQAFRSVGPLIHETQELQYTWSDIAVYDLDREDVVLLPGASSPDHTELYPSWTPDGKRVLFSRAPAGASARTVQYDLFVLDYADGKGGTPIPVPGASGNGRSNYYARFSPDGKWLSFCQADQGSLIEPSSDLYFLPGHLQGPPHRLECNVEQAADSWHSWSSNSRWLLFASKRDDGIHARMYMTHIDHEGHASPAVRVPLQKPPLASFNIPELLTDAPSIEERQLFEAVRAEAPLVTLARGGG